MQAAVQNRKHNIIKLPQPGFSGEHRPHARMLELLDFEYQTLKITQSNELRIVRVKNISFVQSEGNYSWICQSDGSRIMTSKTLKHWAAQLPAGFFLRCHQSFLINRLHVAAIRQSHTSIVTIHGKDIPISRNKKVAVLNAF